jgi:hypothetical protein
MMSVLEYAEDVNKTVEEILNKCMELNISASAEDDLLDEDAIVILDNNLDIDDDEIEEFENNEEDKTLKPAKSTQTKKTK